MHPGPASLTGQDKQVRMDRLTRSTPPGMGNELMDNEQRLKDRVVLIVDDDKEVLEAIDQALKAEGANTRTCHDGNTAVRLCESETPQLVVLDMMLPKRSGFLVLEKVKRLPVPPTVIMVTANEGKRHQQYAEALGVDGYLLKPVRLERLITMAMGLLEKR
jgi:DNA-binding response OmpR family regulator